MKKIWILPLLLLFPLVACSSSREDNSNKTTSDTSSTSNEQIVANTSAITVYFSVTNNTEKIANYIVELKSTAKYEIEPKVPYTDEDINYGDSNSRTTKEQNDDSARPEIGSEDLDLSTYDLIFLGYPIWWGQAPKIMYTFLEKYEDLSGKTIVPFVTSGSSGIGSSATNLAKSAPAASWLEGRRFSSSSSKDEVSNWLDSLPIKNEEKENSMNVYIDNNKLEVTLEDNSSVSALLDVLKQRDIVYQAHDYGDFEKVGDIGVNLPQNNTQITTVPGDVILYQGNNICLYYDTNSWNFTKLGHINGYTQDQLKTLLKAGQGEIEVRISLK